MSESIIHLARGVPPTDVFPVDDLVECAQVALRRDSSVLLQSSRAGYPPLREWLADQYDVGSERILTGNSSPMEFASCAYRSAV